MKLLEYFTKNKKNTRSRASKKSTLKKSTYIFTPENNSKKNTFKRKKSIKVYLPKGNIKNVLYYKVWTLIIIILWAIFLIFWPIMKIESIYITREDKLVNINKSYETLNYLRGKSILFTKSDEIINRLKNNQKSIANIQIKASFPNSLSIHIGSYDIIFQTATHFILRNWLLIEKKDIISDARTILLSDFWEELFSWELQLSADNFYSIEYIISLLEKNIIWFKIKNIYFAETEKELLIYNEAWSIFIFDIEWDLEKQVENLSIFNKESGNINTTPYVYIDVRVSQKLYTCNIDVENLCKNNIGLIYWDEIFNQITLDSSQSLQ